MEPEFIAFVLEQLPMIYGLAAGILIGVAVEKLSVASNRRHRQAKSRDHSRDGPRAASSGPVARRPDAADQLRIVMGAQFSVQPLLNRSEARVFRELDRIVIASNPGWQVMAQVSLGEILRCEDATAYGCINSKRVDLLLVDEECRPRHALEYQGMAHHQGTAAARDAVKKEALRRAGIGYHEVVAGHTTPSDLRRLIGEARGRPRRLTPSARPPANASDSESTGGGHARKKAHCTRTQSRWDHGM